jgi:hypothetical protein
VCHGSQNTCGPDHSTVFTSEELRKTAGRARVSRFSSNQSKDIVDKELAKTDRSEHEPPFLFANAARIPTLAADQPVPDQHQKLFSDVASSIVADDEQSNP